MSCKIFYLHIGRTGGTYLGSQLEDFFEQEVTCNTNKPENQGFDIDDIENVRKYRLIFGHHNRSIFVDQQRKKRYCDWIKIFTFRKPFSIARSAYFGYLNNIRQKLGLEQEGAEADLSHFERSEMTWRFFNHICGPRRYIEWLSETREGFDRLHYGGILDSLDYYTYAIETENIDKFCRFLNIRHKKRLTVREWAQNGNVNKNRFGWGAEYGKGLIEHFNEYESFFYQTFPDSINIYNMFQEKEKDWAEYFLKSE